MHSWQCQLPFNNSSGLFAKTVSWLQNRNRLHGPLRPVDIVHHPSNGCVAQAALRTAPSHLDSSHSLPAVTPSRQHAAFELDFLECERNGTACKSGHKTPCTVLNKAPPARHLILGNPNHQLNSTGPSQQHQQQSLYPAAHIRSHADGCARAQHPNRLSSSALSAAIRDAASLDQLAALYEQHPHSFRSGHVAAAIARMPHAVELRLTSKPRLVDPRHERLLAQLLDRFKAFRAAGEYGARELSSCVWVLGKLGRVEHAGLGAVLASDMLEAHRRHRRLQQQQQLEQAHAEPTLSPIPLAQVCEWTLPPDPTSVSMYTQATSLRVAGTPVVQGTALAPFASRSGGMGASCGSIATASSRAAAGTPVPMVPPSALGGSAEGDVRQGEPPASTAAATATAATDASADRAFPLCPLDLSNMALGLAKTGVVRPAIWQQLVVAAVPMLREFGTQELTNLAWSLAQAHRDYCRRAAAVESAATTTSSGGRVAATAFCGSGPALLAPTNSKQTPATHVKQRGHRGRGGGSLLAEVVAVSNGIAGTGNRDWSDSNGLGPASHTQTQDAAAVTEGARASSGLHGDWQPWLGRFVESALAPRLRRIVRRCTAQQVANGAWALAALGHSDARTLAAVSEEARTRAGGFTAQGLSQVVWAMASMVRMGRARMVTAVAAHGSNRAPGSGSGNPDDIVAGADCAWRAPLLPAGSAVEGTPPTSALYSHLNQPPQQQAPWQEANTAAVGLRRGSHPHRKPPPPQPQRSQPHSPSGFIVPRPALHAIFLASVRSMRRFSPQGLSNLLYAFRTLDFPPSLGLLRRVSRVAVAAPLDRMQPLGLTTLLCEWAARGQHPVGLFTLGAAAATSSMQQFTPRTLCRLLCAYATVGHKDTALFQAAAGRFLQPMVGTGLLAQRPKGCANTDNSRSGGDGRGGEGRGGGRPTAPAPEDELPQPPPGILLDALSPTECYQLVCAYGQVGVHAPALMDHLLLRLTSNLTAYDGRCSKLPYTALRLVVALATVNHRPAAYYDGDGRNSWDDMSRESSTAPEDAARHDSGGTEKAAASTAMTAAICIVRRSVLSLDPPQAVKCMWALIQLQAAGPTAVYRLVTEVLWRRTAPAERDPVSALGAYARLALVADRPWLVSRLVWLLGKGAAAAWRGDGSRAVGSASSGSNAAMEKGGSVRHECCDITRNMTAMASELSRWLVAVAEVLEERLEECEGELLASLAEGLLAVLAAKPAAGTIRRTRRVDDLYDRCAELLLTTVGETLRRATAIARGPRGRIPGSGGCGGGDVTTGNKVRSSLAPRHLAAVVHSVYDSGMHSRTPLLWGPAARGVLTALDSACRSPPVYDKLLAGGNRTCRAVSDVHLGRRLSELEQPKESRPNPHQLMRASHTRVSPDDVALLLAAAMRLDLFSYPSALPVLQKAVHWLIRSDSDSANGSPSTGMSCTSASVSVSSLQALLRYSQQHANIATAPKPPQSPSSRGDAASESSEGGSCAAQLALHAWVVRQATGLLPWMPYTDRELVLSELSLASVEPISSYDLFQCDDDAGLHFDGAGRSSLPRQPEITTSRPPPPMLPLSLPRDIPGGANVDGLR